MQYSVRCLTLYCWNKTRRYIITTRTVVVAVFSDITRSLSVDINGILSYCKTADEFVKLGLVKAYCLPLLTYCIGAIDLPASSVKDLAVIIIIIIKLL